MVGDEPLARGKDALAEIMNRVADRLQLGERIGCVRPIRMLNQKFGGEVFPTHCLRLVRQPANVKYQMLDEQPVQVAEECRGRSL